MAHVKMKHISCSPSVMFDFTRRQETTSSFVFLGLGVAYELREIMMQRSIQPGI